MPIFRIRSLPRKYPKKNQPIAIPRIAPGTIMARLFRSNRARYWRIAIKSESMSIGSSKAAASAVGIVKAMRGVAITPIPAPKPAFDIPMRITEATALNQKDIGYCEKSSCIGHQIMLRLQSSVNVRPLRTLILLDEKNKRGIGLKKRFKRLQWDLSR